METSYDLGKTINTALVQASNLPGFLNSTSGTNGGEPRGVGYKQENPGE